MTDKNELMRDIDRALVALDASKPYTYKPTFSMPALSPQMQDALDAEAEMVAKVLKRAREMEAELLAARARIAELEQQPPMQLVDFGVGVNWKGLREDMQRLRAERDAARSQLQADEQRAWESLNKPEGTYDTTNVQRLCAEVERLRADLREALRLLGQVNEGDMPKDLLSTFRWLDARDALRAKHKETP